MSQAVQPSDFGFFFDVPTRWGDLDSLGHVNNAKYFTFDESARLAYFEDMLGANPTDPSGQGLILARIECDFLAQLHHPSLVRIGYRVTRIGRSSMQTMGGMFVDDRLMAVSRGVVVWFDYRTQQTAAVPDAVREQIRSREPVAPEEPA